MDTNAGQIAFQAGMKNSGAESKWSKNYAKIYATGKIESDEKSENLSFWGNNKGG